MQTVRVIKTVRYIRISVCIRIVTKKPLTVQVVLHVVGTNSYAENLGRVLHIQKIACGQLVVNVHFPMMINVVALHVGSKIMECGADKRDFLTCGTCKHAKRFDAEESICAISLYTVECMKVQLKTTTNYKMIWESCDDYKM